MSEPLDATMTGQALILIGLAVVLVRPITNPEPVLVWLCAIGLFGAGFTVLAYRFLRDFGVEKV